MFTFTNCRAKLREVLGDPDFYNQKMVPAIARLDAAEKKILGTITSDEVATLYDEAISDLMEFEFLVEELRSEYLAKKLLANATQ